MTFDPCKPSFLAEQLAVFMYIVPLRFSSVQAGSGAAVVDGVVTFVALGVVAAVVVTFVVTGVVTAEVEVVALVVFGVVATVEVTGAVVVSVMAGVAEAVVRAVAGAGSSGDEVVSGTTDMLLSLPLLFSAVCTPNHEKRLDNMQIANIIMKPPAAQAILIKTFFLFSFFITIL